MERVYHFPILLADTESTDGTFTGVIIHWNITVFKENSQVAFLIQGIYSIAETAKANRLKPYEYFEFLLTEIPKHMDDKNTDFLSDLLPWSDALPENIRKPKSQDNK